MSPVAAEQICGISLAKVKIRTREWRPANKFLDEWLNTKELGQFENVYQITHQG